VTGVLNEYDALYQEPDAQPAAAPAPAVVPAPAPVPNEYDHLYSDEKAVGDVGVAAATAKDANPDKFALADQIGRAMDLPATVVERNLPELEAKHRQTELVKVLKDNPKLAQWYSQHDNARAVSPEDAANLGTLEQLGNAWERGVLGLRQQGSGLALGADERALQNITAVEGRLARGEDPASIPDIEDTYGVRYMTPDERGALRAQVQRSTGQQTLDIAGREIERNRINVDPTVQAALSAKTWGEFWTHFTEKPLTFIATVGTESLPQMGPTIVAGIVGGLAGGPAGAAAAAGAASYGLDYASSVLDAFRDEGIDLNNPLALRQAVNDPDLMGRVGAKAAAHATAVGTFDALSGGVGSKTLAPARITNRLAREATSMAAQVPVQGALGAAGEATGELAAGDPLQPGNIAAEFFGEMIGAPAEVASITGSSALHAVAENRMAAAAAQRNVDFFKALDTSAAGLAMREKLPERTREAVNAILSNGPVDTVYVPAAKVQELFQSLGLGDQYDDPLSWFDSISPGLGQEYTQAAALGADVAIPLDAYYTSIAGTDAHKILAEHLRLHPGEMTHYEATEWEKDADAAFERAMEEAQSSAGAEQTAAGPADAVFEDVVKRQVDAGMAPDQARQQGALYRAFFRIAGEKFKLDPFALYQRYGFEVRREIPQGLAETPVDQMDLLIDELRSSKQPRQKDLVGHSLLEFISRRGGVLEDAGELGAMDAQLWHQGKRGRRKLVRDPDAPKQPGEDFSLDETARAAWEAGYFPELGDQRPDVNQLLEAIRGELSGKARYAERNVNAAGVERQQMLKDLEAALYTLGIDPATAPNEVVKEALRRAGAGVGAGEALFQPGAKRGSIQLSPGHTVINLFAKADLSTFLHESGHFFLEVTRDLALRGDAPAEVLADWETLKLELGIPDDGPIPVEAHEKFATGFEAYLMEGKAPSAELAGAFQRFKAWLSYVYKTIKNLGGPVSEPVARVMDRMLASADEIAQAEAAYRLAPAFVTAEAGGMTEAEFRGYMATAQAATDSATRELEKRLMLEVRREQEAQWKARRVEIRGEVEAEMAARPVYRALAFLRGKDLDGAVPVASMRLDREEVVALIGEVGLKRLPRSVPPVYAKQGGVDPGLVGDMFGFGSGAEMLEALMAVAPLAQAVEAETDARMHAEFGDLMSDRAGLAEAADAAVHSDQRALFLATELRALARKSGRNGRAVPAQAARDIARAVIGRTKIGDIRISVYAKAEQRAAREAEQAILSGDMAAATEAKRKQLLNHMLVVEARKAADTVEAAVKYLGKFRRKRPAGGIDAEYYAQIRELLERHDLRPVSGPQLEKRESLLAFVTAQQALGNPISVPDELLDEAKRQHIKQMTLSEVEGLRDTVKQIAHLGKLKKTLQTNKDKREFEAGRNSVVLRIETRPEARLPSPDRNPQRWERFTSWARGMDAALLKMEQVIEWLDGGPTGPLHDFVWDRFVGAQGAEMDLQVKVAGDLERAFRRLPREQRRRFKDKVLVPELGGKTYRRDELLAVALNTGNEGNLTKMLEGEAKRGGAWDRDAVFRALGRLLSKEEWALVQEIWDTIEQLWPETAALEKRLTGVEPVKVERQPVTTPYGVLPGGYYPVVYDPRLDPGAERHQEAAATALFENFITKPTTASGHTKERTGVVKPVLLDLDVLVRHVNQVIHRITHQEAIMQAHRLLTDAKVRAAIESRESPEVYKQFVPWLQAIANDRVQETGLRSWDQLANGIRANTTMMGMGYRISTMLAQIAGFSNTAEVVGPLWMLKGIWMTYGNPLKTAEAYRFAKGKSAELRHRADTMERDIRDSLRGLTGQRGMAAQVKRFAFYGIAMMDGFVSVATWMAGYHKQLAADPNDDVAAVAAGDRAVRSSQGAGAVKDQAAIQRQPGLWKFLTMFYSFFSVLYNRLRDLGRATKQAVRTGAVRDFPHLLARGFFLLVVPAVLGDILVGKGPDDDKDEDWASWMAKKVAAYPFMSLPVVRDVIGGKTSGFGYQFTPAARAVETVGKLIDDMVKAFDPDQDVDGKQATRHAIETTGYVFGLPLGQVSTTFGNVWDGLENGDLAFRDLFLSRAK
jgi:hypothetical protein